MNPMKTKFLYIIILPLLCLASATSCVHEYAVVDNSFEFVADVTYDGGANQQRLTLTRKSGAPDNQYKIAFTLDGESTMTLTDANGMTIKNLRISADEVEEAIGEIGDCRYAEDSGLGHAASVPGYKYGGHGNGIFSGAAQQAAFVTVTVIYVLEHVAGEDDGDVLVGGGHVEEKA